VDILKFVTAQPEHRLDLYLTKVLPHLSREFIQKLIRGGQVMVGGKPWTKPSKNLKAGVEVVVEVPDIKPLELLPESLPLTLIFEDSDLVIVDKPSGMSVHPGAGQSTGTLVNALLHHVKNLSGIGGVERPGIVHRLDKETSGLIVIAKNDFTHQALSEQFAGRAVKKSYIAIAHGVIKQEEFTVDVPIGRDTRHRKRMTVTPQGRMAITDFQVVKNYYPHACLLYCFPMTGRTHQIRVHLSVQSHPVVGDKLYGGNPQRKSIELLKEFPRHALHAYAIKFKHPRTGRSMKFECPIPEDMEHLMEKLEILNTAPRRV
jgi:23S rRNA pseudouridine1911/1915/1917 synthase